MWSHYIMSQISIILSPLSNNLFSNKFGRVVNKSNGLSPVKSQDTFLCSHVRSRDKLKALGRGPTKKRPPNFHGLRFSVRGLTTSLDGKWKIQVKIQIFILQDSRTTKLGWEETYSKTWCDEIMQSIRRKDLMFQALV